MTHYTKGTTSPVWAPSVCRHPVSGTISLPSSGCFSPFPHGTGSLSVAHEYLGLEGGPPMFRQDFSCPVLLKSLVRRYLLSLIHISEPTRLGMISYAVFCLK